jgi:predicted nuclease of predicted toxin-antitoxin system
MLRLLADENLDHDIVRGVLRRRTAFDIVRVQNAGLSETDDAKILAWAAFEQRVVLTHDVNTMIKFATERLLRGEPMAGLLIVRQEGAALSKVIDDLLLMDECSETAEWAEQILYLPLR